MLEEIKTYDDEKLIFDTKTQKYYLTIPAVYSELDNTFGDDKVLERRIKKNTRIVYQYITTHIANFNVNMALSLINHTNEGRAFIYDVLMSQMNADLENAFNDKGIEIRKEGESKDLLADQTISLIESSIAYFGFNLLQAFEYDLNFPIYHDIEKWVPTEKVISSGDEVEPIETKWVMNEVDAIFNKEN